MVDKTDCGADCGRWDPCAGQFEWYFELSIGYTKGGRNEIFAARPCPVQIAMMGFAGTMGAGLVNDPQNPPETHKLADQRKHRWIDYLVADELAVPRNLVCGEGDDDRNRVYTEGMIYLPNSFFVNDHKQNFRDLDDPRIGEILANLENAERNVPSAHAKQLNSLRHGYNFKFRHEQLKRLQMRQELFPGLPEHTVIFANFNQLYKIDPMIFKIWLQVLQAVPNSILWLLRFPPAGEFNLRQFAVQNAGEEVASRVVFTDVAPKHVHIHRGRIADVFFDTPECNAHTTAADILWSGTPIITFPKYNYKMCSRVAASVCYATGRWDNALHYKLSDPLPERLKSDTGLVGHAMVVWSYDEYLHRAIEFGQSMVWKWQSLSTDERDCPTEFTGACLYPATNPRFIYAPTGLCADLRKHLFLNRDHSPLFDTRRYMRDLEIGITEAYKRFLNPEKDEKDKCIIVPLVNI
jgi:Glycosyl transferase family 41